MSNVKVTKGTVKRFPQGSVVDADCFGDDLQRLVKLGVVEATEDVITHDANGDELPAAEPVHDQPEGDEHENSGKKTKRKTKRKKSDAAGDDAGDQPEGDEHETNPGAEPDPTE